MAPASVLVAGLLATLPLVAQDVVEVSGRVVGPDGRPVSGVAVSLASGDVFDRFERSLDTRALLDASPARSDDEGRFRIRMPAGDSLYVARDRHVALRIRHPGFRTAAAVPLGDVVLAGGVTLVGRVVSRDGAPLTGARVVARENTGIWSFGGQLSAQAVTSGVVDGDGRFRLPCAAPAGLLVMATADGYGMQVRYPVAQDTPLRFVLEPTGHFAGRVVDVDGAPVDARVDVTYELFDWNAGAAAARTDADGRFRLTRLLPGRARLSASVPPDGIARRFAISEILDGPDDELVLRPRARTAADGSASAVRIHVVDGDGAAVAGADVMVRWTGITSVSGFDDIGFDRARGRWRTGEDGTATVPRPAHAPPEGTLRVAAPGFARELTAIRATGDALRIEMRPEARIGGCVRDAAGDPVAGAHVWWLELPTVRSSVTYRTMPPQAVTTDASGRFVLDGVPQGEVEVQVHHPAFQPPPARRLRAVAGETITADFALAPGRRVTALLESDGAGWSAALRGGAVRARGDLRALFSGGRVPPRTRIDEDGRFVFEHVADGALTLTVARPSRTVLPYTISFDAAEIDATGDQEIVVPKASLATGFVTGQLTTADAAFARLAVFAVWTGELGSKPRAPAYGAPVDPAGRYRIEAPPGSYELQLVDLRSNLVVAVLDPVVVGAGMRADRPLEPALRSLRIELVPREDGGTIRPRAIHLSRRGTTEDQRFAPSGDRWSRGVVELAAGEHSLELLVPDAPVTLRVEDGSVLLTSRGASYVRWLAEVDLEPGDVRDGVLRIPVHAPLPVDQIDDAAGERAGSKRAP